MKNKTIAGKIGLFLALLHLVAFFAFVVYIEHSTEPQTPLLWGVFAIVDFPVSLFYLLGRIAQFLYLPYIIHGLLGTIWWYFLPRVVTPRRLGGVW